MITLDYAGNAALTPSNAEFVQTEDLTEAGIGVQKYGGFLIPAAWYTGSDTTIDIELTLGADTYTGELQLVAEEASGSDPAVPAVQVGDTIKMTKQV